MSASLKVFTLQSTIPDSILLLILLVPGFLFVYLFRHFSRVDRSFIGNKQEDYAVASVVIALLILFLIMSENFYSTGEIIFDPFILVSTDVYFLLYLYMILFSLIGGSILGWIIRRIYEYRSGTILYRGTILEQLPIEFEGSPRIRLGVSSGDHIRGVWRKDDEKGILIDKPMKIIEEDHTSEPSVRSRMKLGNSVYIPYSSISYISVHSQRANESDDASSSTEYKTRLPLTTNSVIDYSSDISFSIENDKEFTLAFVEATIDLLNSSDVLVSREVKCMYNLRPSQKFRFTISMNSSEEICNHQVNIIYNEF